MLSIFTDRAQAAPALDLSPKPFHKRLRWLIQNPPEGSVVMMITPADAEELLRRNTGEDYQNRPESTPTVKRYVEAMRAGWKLTGETIIISRAGNLLNGQHRLRACVESGCSFPCHVIFGIDDDAFAFMDIGRKRTAGDIFAINGVPNFNSMAAASAWVWRYYNTGMVNPASWMAPTNDQLYAFYLANSELQNSYNAGRRFAQNKIAPPALMVALHYLCSDKNRDQANGFFERIATGVGCSQPEARLRKRLVDAKIGGTKLGDLHVGAFTVQTWNAIRQKKPIGAFRWRGEQNPDQPFPRIV